MGSKLVSTMSRVLNCELKPTKVTTSRVLQVMDSPSRNTCCFRRKAQHPNQKCRLEEGQIQNTQKRLPPGSSRAPRGRKPRLGAASSTSGSSLLQYWPLRCQVDAGCWRRHSKCRSFKRCAAPVRLGEREVDGERRRRVLSKDGGQGSAGVAPYPRVLEREVVGRAVDSIVNFQT